MVGRGDLEDEERVDHQRRGVIYRTPRSALIMQHQNCYHVTEMSRTKRQAKETPLWPKRFGEPNIGELRDCPKHKNGQEEKKRESCRVANKALVIIDGASSYAEGKPYGNQESS